MEVNTGALQEPFKILPPPKWERNLSYAFISFQVYKRICFLTLEKVAVNNIPLVSHAYCYSKEPKSVTAYNLFTFLRADLIQSEAS